jgi:thioredoxin 2
MADPILHCPNCGRRNRGRMVSPALEQLARERAGELKLVKIDCDAAPKLVERFSVQAVPTLLVMHQGQILSRQSGAPRLDGLRRWVDQALGRAP